MFIMNRCTAVFQESRQELRRLSSLTGSAMLAGLATLLNQFTFKISVTLRLSFGFLATAVGGMLYGPVLAGLMGVVVDVLRYLVVGGGAFFPGFTLNELLSGMIYGFFLYRQKPTLLRVAAARACVMVLVNLCLTPLWLSILYGKQTWLALMLERLVKNLVMFPVEVILLLAVCRLLHQVYGRRLAPLRQS